MDLSTIMVPTGDEEEPSAVKKETQEKSVDEADAEDQETSTKTTKPLERPRYRDGSIVVETDAFTCRQDPPPPIINDEGNVDKDEEKKQESHGKVLCCDTQMDGATPSNYTDDSCLLTAKEEERKPHQQPDNSSYANTPQQQQQQLPATLSKRARRSPNTDHSSSTACLPTTTPPAATATATPKRIKEGKTSAEEHDTASGTASTPPQGMTTPTSVQQQPAGSSTTSTDVNHGQQNGSRARGSTPLLSQPQKQQDHQRQQQRHAQDHDNESEASSVTTLSQSDQPGAFRIHPNPDGAHDNDDDDDDGLTYHDGEIATVTSNGVAAPSDPTAAVSSPGEVLPMAHTLEDDVLEREILERVRSRQPVVQAESIPLPSASSTMNRWVPWVLVLIVLISAIFITLSGMGILLQRDKMNQLSSRMTAAPSSIDDAATPIDIRPIVQWLEPFLTNRSFVIPSDPSSAQYRAVLWLSQQEHASNVTLEADLRLWVQYYVLVTLYYSTGGDTGTWNNDRLWLSTEPLCDCALITCLGSSEPANDDGEDENIATNTTSTDVDMDPENGFGNGATVITDLSLRTLHIGIFYGGYVACFAYSFLI
jgi:hypothetical protein